MKRLIENTQKSKDFYDTYFLMFLLKYLTGIVCFYGFIALK